MRISKTASVVSVLFMSIGLVACGNSRVTPASENSLTSFGEPYFGLDAPRSKADVFLPNLISTRDDERCVTFLDAGKVCLYTTDDGGTIYSSLNNGQWSQAQPFPFNYKGDMLDYTAGPHGRSLVFMSSRPIGPDDSGGTHHLWTAKWNGSGWDEPVPLSAPEKIDGNGAGYPTISANGTLYFISDPREGSAEGGIFRCSFEGSEYGKAELVEYPINTKYIDFDPYVAPDDSYLVFNSNRPGGFGLWDTYVSFRKEDGSWTSAVNLGQGFNTEYSEACPNVTPDGKFLFFASSRQTDFLKNEDGSTIPTGRDAYWADASVIHQLRDRYLQTESSEEIVRAEYRELGLAAAIQTLEGIHAGGTEKYSFQPNELLPICDEMMAAGHFEDAKLFYEALLQLLPEKSRIKLGYALICTLNGRLEAGVGVLQELQSDERDFNLEYAVIHLGSHLNRFARLGDEIELYEAFSDELESSFRLHLYLAEAYESLGALDKALENCRKASAIDPGHSSVIDLLERLEGITQES
ncbi:MAG: hypothetical protein GY906_20625 [bacterium]|nr:hypothetical protein [bacterium]